MEKVLLVTSPCSGTSFFKYLETLTKTFLFIGITLSFAILPAVVSADNSSSLYFDGIDDYVSTADTPELSITGDFTIEFWAKFESFDNGLGTLVSKYGGPTDSDRAYYISYYEKDGVGTTETRISTIGTGPSTSIGTIEHQLALNTWYHMAYVYDASAGEIKFYVADQDSEPVLFGTMVGHNTYIKDSVSEFMLGSSSGDDPKVFFQGKMDEVRVWNDIRDEGEIRNNYQQELVGDEPNLVAYWKFENDLSDSTNANDFTDHGGTAFSLDVPFSVDTTTKTMRIYAGEGDGYTIARNYSNDWDELHDRSTAMGEGLDTEGAFYSGDSDIYVQTSHYYKFNRWSYVAVRPFIPFDTSTIPDDAIIENATLNLYPADWRDGSTTIYVVQTSQNSIDAVIPEDFDQAGAIDNPIAGGSFNNSVPYGSYASVPLNASGLSWIDKNGWTKLGLRTSDDAFDNAPTSNNGISFHSSEVSNDYERPYLEIEYKLADVTPEPTGASSVLFLPGIQASRLYMNENGRENQLWEPNRNDDVEKLAMTEEGVSVNNVYTKDVLDEIVTGGNIYKSFLKQMEDLRSEGVIEDFVPFAYDWRYSVFDVATDDVSYADGQTKKLVDEILKLAEDSYTGKVTIIGHSNGGLVAKALLSEYGETELVGKVDKLIMIGTPQLGTPKAIGSMLHGLDQSLGKGLVASADTIRQVTKNLPGVYTLLPSPKYFASVDGPIITTDGSESAQPVSAYGEIDSADKLQNFLLDNLDNRDEAIGLNEPITLNAQMASESLSMQAVLDAWQAPAGVEVYEVLGTGLATIAGYEYRELNCKKTHALCALNSYVKPFPLMTNDGDQTVVAVSAEGYGGDKVTAKVNLKGANKVFLTKNREHKDLTENNQVQVFIDSVIKYPYVTDAVMVPEFAGVSSRYRIIGVHSPVSLLATDEEGLQVGLAGGEIKEDISGSQYFEFGGSKYLVLPSEANVVVELVGTGEGVYSLSIDEINEFGEQSQVSFLANAEARQTMSAEFSIENDVYSLLQTDLDGDGVIDLQQTLDGEEVQGPGNEYSYEDLELAITDLYLERKYEKKLLMNVHLAKFFSQKSYKNAALGRLEIRALEAVLSDLQRYHRRGIITEGDLNSIIRVIKYIENHNE